MFRNENLRNYTHRGKSKSSKIKISSSQTIHSITEHSKKPSKLRKNHKHSKLKHVTAVSDYIGPERLTNHVGVFAKGKVSDSISRLEKRMPSEVRARAKQDLLKVLKLTNKEENMHRKKLNVRHKNKNLEHSFHSSVNTPHYLYHKTGFASTSWKDKLTKSVRLASVNSILASVNKQPPETSTNNGELLKARQALLTKIYPCLRKVNYSIFPDMSNKDKVKTKLLSLKNKCIPPISPSDHASICSIISEIPQNSPHGKIVNECPSVEKEDFQLNPILTGEAIDHRNLTNIFPHVNNFVEYNDDLTTFANYTYENNEVLSSPILSSIGIESSVTLVPSSPASSGDSPSWKLQISPVKFVPAEVPTPTLYFRHKMF